MRYLAVSLLVLSMFLIAPPRLSAAGHAGSSPFVPLFASSALEPIALDSCTTINTPGAYQLAGNLVADWGCINIHADDVMLDCAGSTIEGKLFRGNGIVVESEAGAPPRQNIEIKNCRIFHFLYGIAIEHGKNIFIHHNDLSDNFDDTNGTYQGAWLGLFDGGGLRLNFVESSRVESNIVRRGTNGIDARDSRTLAIRNNTAASTSAFGIVLTNTSDSLVEGNRVEDNVRWCTFPGEQGQVIVPGCDAAGIMIQDGSNRNIVRSNLVLGQNGDGIFVRNHTGRCGDDSRIENNQIVGAVWNGIEAGFCDNLQITGNTFASSKFGAWISYMDNVVLQNNRFSGIEQTGVVLKNSHHARIQNNSFAESGGGIFVFADASDEKFGWTLRHPFAYYRSYANVISGNSFFNLTAGSIQLSDSTENQISANRFVNAPTQVQVTGTR
jgi:parallel beta-helix repeat protein